MRFNSLYRAVQDFLHIVMHNQNTSSKIRVSSGCATWSSQIDKDFRKEAILCAHELGSFGTWSKVNLEHWLKEYLVVLYCFPSPQKSHLESIPIPSFFPTADFFSTPSKTFLSSPYHGTLWGKSRSEMGNMSTEPFDVDVAACIHSDKGSKI